MITSESNYYESYDNISVHNLMLRDRVRVEKYREAILNSKSLFKDKIVLDVGSGSGVLSLFCAQAGAKHVYAVEASKGISELSKAIIKTNSLSDKITVINGEIEKIELEVEKVDIIVSEWMGVYLLHESMLNSVFYARDKWLKKDGLMYPSCAYLYVCPVSMDEYLKENIKYWQNYYGLNFDPMRRVYRELLLEKPIVETISSENLIDEEKILASFDLRTVKRQELETVQGYNIEFTSNKNCNLHGFAFWFDVIFNTDDNVVTLTTSPASPSTHWKQTIALLPEALTDTQPALKEDEKFECYVIMNQSDENARNYLIDIGVNLDLDSVNENKRERENEEEESEENEEDSEDEDDGEEHPMPCDRNCKRIKCILIKATLEKYEKEKSTDTNI